MNDKCLICHGLIQLSTQEYAEQDDPALFQLITTCKDCGRHSTYDCVKTSPEKVIIDSKFPDLREPDEALYRKDVSGMHKRAQDYINRTRSEEAHTRSAEPEPDNVIEFNGSTRHDIPPERIVKHLGNLDIQEIVAVGFLEDGSEFFSSSKSDGAAALWRLSRAQHKLMTLADLEEGE